MNTRALVSLRNVFQRSTTIGSINGYNIHDSSSKGLLQVLCSAVSSQHQQCSKIHDTSSKLRTVQAGSVIDEPDFEDDFESSQVHRITKPVSFREKDTSNFDQRGFSRSTYNSREEDEEEYDVSEEDLEKLRQQHRDESEEHVSSGSSFADYPLHPYLLEKLTKLGYNVPFEIQTSTLTHTLAGKDVIGRAVTGSGKTLAFSIPIVQKILESRSDSDADRHVRRNKNPKAIVISPTRELCLQIYRSIQELDSSVRCVALYGGDPYIRQEREINRGIDVICATPGRLRDHLQRGNFALDQLEFLCLDEADELLTPNFKDQIEDVLENSPKSKQMMLFSATMPYEIKRIAERYMRSADIEYIDITKSQKYAAPENIVHQCMFVPGRNQVSTVADLIQEHQAKRCIVFMSTKVKCRETTHILRRKIGMKADALHSDLSQNRREIIMAAFRSGQIKTLVATDVAARGLDIPEVDLVIQVGPPLNGTDYYIHRSGRTGRAGRAGMAIMLHSGMPREKEIIREIERKVKMSHVTAPHHGESKKRAVEHIMKSLKNVSAEDLRITLPFVETLDLSDESGAQQLLASAIALVLNQQMSGGADASEYAEESYSSRRRQQSQRYSSSFNDRRNHTNERPWKNSSFRKSHDDEEYY